MNAKVNFQSKSLIDFPKPCTLCSDRTNVLLTMGLWVCDRCANNMKSTNPNMFHADVQTPKMKFKL